MRVAGKNFANGIKATKKGIILDFPGGSNSSQRSLEEGCKRSGKKEDTT